MPPLSPVFIIGSLAARLLRFYSPTADSPVSYGSTEIHTEAPHHCQIVPLRSTPKPITVTESTQPDPATASDLLASNLLPPTGRHQSPASPDISTFPSSGRRSPLPIHFAGSPSSPEAPLRLAAPGKTAIGTLPADAKIRLDPSSPALTRMSPFFNGVTATKHFTVNKIDTLHGSQSSPLLARIPK